MKKRSTAALLAVCLGGIGIHKFYLGQIGRGALYMVFSWTFIPMLISVLEAISFMSYSEEAWNKIYNKGVDTRAKKKCLACAEFVLEEANKCKHCGYDFTCAA